MYSTLGTHASNHPPCSRSPSAFSLVMDLQNSCVLTSQSRALSSAYTSNRLSSPKHTRSSRPGPPGMRYNLYALISVVKRCQGIRTHNSRVSTEMMARVPPVATQITHPRRRPTASSSSRITARRGVANTVHLAINLSVLPVRELFI